MLAAEAVYCGVEAVVDKSWKEVDERIVSMRTKVSKVEGGRTETACGVAYECASTGNGVEDAVDPKPGIGYRKGPACALAQPPHAAKGESWRVGVSM